jgi:GDP-mannose transporter
MSETPSLINFVVSGGLYAASSVSMFLVNKWAVKVFPFTCSIIYLQNAVTIVVLLILGSLNSAFAVEWDNVAALRWTPAVGFFLVMLTSSLQAMKGVSVPTFVVFRNLNSISVALGDRYFLKRKITPITFVSLAIIVLGSVVYGYYDLGFDASGYWWMAVNLAATAAYTLFVKALTQRYKYSSFTMSFYNNVLSLPPLVALLVMHSELTPAVARVWTLSFGDGMVVLISCLLGFCISFFGFKAQKVFTATAWITINNLNKIPAILLGIVVFRDRFSLQSLSGLCISMLGGFLFAYEGWRITQEEQRQKAARI